ncbi:MAG: HAD family phosphatase [Anaerolineae bacterium]|nr:HAD family phosphatase [Anaerolineae bacterium]
MSEAKGVIWDLDGVIVDTATFHFEAWRKSLEEMGLPFSQEEFALIFGRRNRDIIAEVVGETLSTEEMERISARKESLFREALRGNIRALPGVLFWLEELQRRGYRQALATSAPQENMEMMVGSLGIEGFFDKIVLADKVSAGKPDPEIFLFAAKALELSPARCVVIEDAVAGVKAAKRAGMRCIALATSHPRTALAEADMVVDSLNDLATDAFELLLSS